MQTYIHTHMHTCTHTYITHTHQVHIFDQHFHIHTYDAHSLTTHAHTDPHTLSLTHIHTAQVPTWSLAVRTARRCLSLRLMAAICCLSRSSCAGLAPLAPSCPRAFFNSAMCAWRCACMQAHECVFVGGWVGGWMLPCTRARPHTSWRLTSSSLA